MYNYLNFKVIMERKTRTKLGWESEKVKVEKLPEVGFFFMTFSPPSLQFTSVGGGGKVIGFRVKQ